MNRLCPVVPSCAHSTNRAQYIGLCPTQLVMCVSPTFHKWKVNICIQPGHALSCPTQKYKALGHDGSCPARAPTKIFIVGKLFLKHAYNPFPFSVSEISFYGKWNLVPSRGQYRIRAGPWYWAIWEAASLYLDVGKLPPSQAEEACCARIWKTSSAPHLAFFGLALVSLISSKKGKQQG